MTPEQFAYWLQGFAELNDKAPTQEQWDSIRAHIALVFKKATPVVSTFSPMTDVLRRMYGPDFSTKVTC